MTEAKLSQPSRLLDAEATMMEGLSSQRGRKEAINMMIIKLIATDE